LQDVDKIERDADIIFGSTRAIVWKLNARIEGRVLEQTGLEQISLCDTDLLKRGLQSSIVEQRDLHRAISGERLAREPLDSARELGLGSISHVRSRVHSVDRTQHCGKKMKAALHDFFTSAMPHFGHVPGLSD
jgi:hypothetical protein